MSLYRIKIQLCSPVITALKGDTLWGHIVWGIANHEGDNAVQEFLEAEKQTPLIIVSSAFPSGYICKPIPLPLLHNDDLTADKYAEIKKNKRVKYLSADTLLSGISETAKHTGTASFSAVNATHNTIDRVTGTVVDQSLFTVREYWPSYEKGAGGRYTPSCFDIYAESSLNKERIRELFEWAFENGYGADSSTGKGRIKVIGDPEKVSPKQKSGTYMALGPFILSEADGDCRDLRSDVFTRAGKLGGSFADSTSAPYKKTVVLYDEGAVFSSDKERAYIGRLITNVHSDERICQSGFAPVIPVVEKEGE